MAERFGNYEILRKIAAGGMAEVFLAKHSGLGGFERLVCIKRILPHLGEQEDFISMFQDEARIAANLTHPNIAQIYDIGETDGSYYIAMEYVRGEDLRRIYNAEVTKGRAMALDQAAQIIMFAAAGLDYAHRQTTIDGRPLGLVHRDISPQNVLVTYDGHVKIVDFGVAKAAIKMTETRTGVLKGKYSYMSPEQASGDPIDSRSDIFALGITLYEVTTGTRLFKRENELETLHAVIECDIKRPSQIIPDYSPDLEALILRALAYDPDDRFATAGDFERELERFLVARQQPTSPSSLGGYMQDLFAEKLADELLFGGQPWDEQNTSSGAENAPEPPRPVVAEPSVSLVLEETDVSAAKNRAASEDTIVDKRDIKTVVDSGWDGPKVQADHWGDSSDRGKPRVWPTHPGSLTQTQGAGTLHRQKTDQFRRLQRPRQGEPSVAPTTHTSGYVRRPLSPMSIAGSVVAAVVVLFFASRFLLGDGALGPRSGPLTIDSEPRGARVEFVGIGGAELTKAYRMERTPMTIDEGLPIDIPLIMRVTKDGFDVGERDFPPLEAGVVPRPIYVELTSRDRRGESASLQLRTTPTGAEVWIDNHKIEGVTPLDGIGVKGGEMHRIEFRKWGHKTTAETRFVEPGARVFVDKILEPVSDTTPLTDLQQLQQTAAAVPQTFTGVDPALAAGAVPSTAQPEAVTPGATPLAAVPMPPATQPAATPTPSSGLATGAVTPTPAAEALPKPTVVKRPGRATISITSPIKLRVSVGSRYVGETPIRRLTLDAGLHRLRLESRREGFTLRRKVRLSPGRTESLTIKPGKGVLSVNASPWAWVRLGKQPPAETPVRLTIYEGEYQVAFECPDGSSQKQSVRVRPGKTSTLKVDCRK